MPVHHRPVTPEEAVEPIASDPAPDVRSWQAAKIEAGLKDADEGRFASAERVREIVRKYIPNG